MMKKMRADGFSAVGIVIALVIVTVIGLVAWRMLAKNDKTVNTTTQQINNTEKTSDFQAPSGWVWYENSNLGFKFAYPNSWAIGELRTLKTAAGEEGWTITAIPADPQNGDPGITFSTYPANATIRDVDAGSNDVKVQDISTADNVSFTLAGIIEDPSKVTKPTQTYLSSCWPRNCAPKLANGRFLNVAVDSINNNCTKGMVCPTEINTSGENYSIFLNLLKSITSI